MSDRMDDVLSSIDDVLAAVAEQDTPEIEFTDSGYVIYDEAEYFERTGRLVPHPPPKWMQAASPETTDARRPQ